MLTCELCGGSEILKKDGVFVCETCGTKYSLEEARKLMGQKPVEVSGTVAIDNSTQISNLIELAEIAAEGNDISGVINYCHKIIELDSSHYRAYLLLAKTVGWDSSIHDDKIKMALTYGKKAVQYCPDEYKTFVAEEIWSAIRAQLYGLIQWVLKKPTYTPKIAEYMREMVDCLTQLPCISTKVLNEELQTIRRFEVNRKLMAATDSIDDLLPIIVKGLVKHQNKGIPFSAPLEAYIKSKQS